ncbi:MAG: DUF484 family protein [Pseudomonadota bacterium]
MSDPVDLAADLRARILERPDAILADADVMRALASANDAAMGSNIVDLRGVAMGRLEDQLSALESTHQSVISAAYENLAGTNQIHRAILAFLEPLEFEDFLRCLNEDIADILRVGKVRLILESYDTAMDPTLAAVADVMSIAAPGFCDDYAGDGRAPRQVTLRAAGPKGGSVYGEAVAWVASEAVILLDLGESRLPGMLLLASDDPDQFHASQGTDLLGFLGGVFERAMRRWLG